MKKIVLEYGMFLFLCLLGFFLFMVIVGYATDINLRYFNSIIHLAIMYLAIKEFYKESNTPSINYLKGIAVGVTTSLFGIVMFVLFQLVFLHLDPTFLGQIKETFLFGSFLNPFTVAAAIFVEGLVMSFIGSYAITRLIENSSTEPYMG